MELTMSISLLAYAFVLGLAHAFEADHLAAMTTFSKDFRNKKHSSKIGAYWGFGHTTTLFLVGGVLLLFKLSIPSVVEASFEAVVGVMLVLLGVQVFYKIRKDKLHVHQHEHDGVVHSHLHSHKGTATHTHGHRSFAVGVIHGLAGSGALLLLVLAASVSLADGLVFILVFGLGSVVGMAFVGLCLGYMLEYAKHFTKVYTALHYGAGVFSIYIGLSLVAGYLFP